MPEFQPEGALQSYSKVIGLMLIVLAVVIFVSVSYHNSARRQQPIVFSDRSMLDGLWHYHNAVYLDAANSRTVDKQAGEITTSEGESYTMLRAVWWSDKDTFDKSWAWTQQNLQHKATASAKDNLFSWYYGRHSDGSFGVITETGGNNSASDADTDIALALLFAHDRWGDQKYLDDAKAVIKDIWNIEVLQINGKPYLLADNLEKQITKKDLLVNPSYLAPYAYKIFAKYDPANDWIGLADNSYQVLSDSMTLALDKKTSASLPPNWILINRDTGVISASPEQRLNSAYGYDAMRVPFRLALDWMWFNDVRAKNLLSKMSFLGNQWNTSHSLSSEFAHDGTVQKIEEAPAIYGGSLGYFLVTDPAAAESIYNNKLKILYTPDTDSWKHPLSYYDENWAWFGMALYNKLTINLEPR